MVLSIVGLSLEVAMPRLAPELDANAHEAMVAGYRAGFRQRRESGGIGATPLYPGIREVVEGLAAEPQTVLGIATGKSLRGLEALLEGHGLRQHFVTVQVADHHPSKPHPSMLMAAMAETGIGPERALMIGDTSFDMDMARSAGMRGLAVAWGYHPASELRGATGHVAAVDALPAAIDALVAPAGETAA
ncbi:HAD-IA family hydrolase [Pseudooceanicola sp. LIPI14-2-Ac024]|uniref:HAD-IA family hydrolase n=1 Tax=Pseudooceanicola sp. LIPI14-2-Ac024 TaxID=3344875 RepID=UPI0035D0FBC6